MTVEEIHKNLLEVLVKAVEAHSAVLDRGRDVIGDPTRVQMELGRTQAQVTTAKLACRAAGIHESEIRLIVDLSIPLDGR